MARVNIEESLFKDQRWMRLVIKTGSPEMAMGALIFLWITAQKYWKRDRSRIPKSVWVEQGLQDVLLETGWAEWDEEYSGYHAAGSEKSFAWLIQKVESGRSGANSTNAKRRRDSDDLEVGGTAAADGGTAAAHGGSRPLPLTPPLPPSPVPSQPLPPLREEAGSEDPAPTATPERRRREEPTGPLPGLPFGESSRDLLEGVSHRVQKNWMVLYPPEMVIREFVKMESWIIVNPLKARKSPRGKAQFISNWLQKAYVDFQKQIPSNRPQPQHQQRRF